MVCRGGREGEGAEGGGGVFGADVYAAEIGGCLYPEMRVQKAKIPEAFHPNSRSPVQPECFSTNEGGGASPNFARDGF